jgi:hypothetical protein
MYPQGFQFCTCSVAASTAACAGLLAASPAFAEGVSFVTPGNGKAVSSPVHVEFAVDGLTVRPAGELQTCSSCCLEPEDMHAP